MVYLSFFVHNISSKHDRETTDRESLIFLETDHTTGGPDVVCVTE